MADDNPIVHSLIDLDARDSCARVAVHLRDRLEAAVLAVKPGRIEIGDPRRLPDGALGCQTRNLGDLPGGFSELARNRGRKTGNKRAKSTARKSPSPKAVTPESTAPKKPSRKRKVHADGASAQPAPAPQKSGGNTPLRIPYGNKELAQKLGARYGAGGWYAPPGIDLAAFSAQGWL